MLAVESPLRIGRIRSVSSVQEEEGGFDSIQPTIPSVIESSANVTGIDAGQSLPSS